MAVFRIEGRASQAADTSIATENQKQPKPDDSACSGSATVATNANCWYEEYLKPIQEAGYDGYSGPVGIRQSIAGRSTVEHAEVVLGVMAKGVGIACVIVIILLLVSGIALSYERHRIARSKERSPEDGDCYRAGPC